MKCTQTPGCTGTYDHEGWCSSCGMKMQEGTTALTPPRPSVSAVPSHEPPSISTDSRVGASPTQGYGPSTHASGAHGAGLVTLPKIEPLDPASLIMPNPEVAEGHRFCANPECGQPVGRQRGDEPPRAQGFCTKCQHPFSFVPRLNPGDVVGGQYEVVGCLAHGGLGWIYLAKDRNVHNVWRRSERTPVPRRPAGHSERARRAAFPGLGEPPEHREHHQLRRAPGRRLHRHGVRRREELAPNSPRTPRRKRRTA